MNESSALNHLLEKLRKISRRGPIPSIGTGPNAVGMTLLDALEMEHSSTSKPTFNGIVVNASRSGKSGTRSRVNLFAQVPNWSISNCKSSRDILERFGYTGGSLDNKKRLNCTVQANHPNPQGLYLKVAQFQNILEEKAYLDGEQIEVAAWNMEKLQERLLQNHPASMWVTAMSTEVGNLEHFHYKQTHYSGPPDMKMLRVLLETGTITVDHLISTDESNQVKEKGPLFKINPKNVSALFPLSEIYNLFT